MNGRSSEIPKAGDWGDAKRLKEIRESLRTFNRKEFQDLPGLPVPMPPIGRQHDMLIALEHSTSTASAKRTEAQTLRASAWKTFEAALFETGH